MMCEKSPMVSVIMGIYNCADTLSEAIESVLGQTYRDFELILCNDGSTDGTLEVAKRYAQLDPGRVILIENEKNMGLNYTLNHCLRVARGRYIARMDGDDRSLPQRFQMEVDFLDAHPEFALVSANLEVFDDNGVWGHTSFPTIPQPVDLVTRQCFSHSACMVRKSVFDEVGGYSEGKWLMRVEDAHLWYKIYAAGYRGANLPEILYSYRDDPNSYRKRKLCYRFNRAYVYCLAIREFGLSPVYYLRALRPILVGLLPMPVYIWLHKRKMDRNGRKHQ